MKFNQILIIIIVFSILSFSCSKSSDNPVNSITQSPKVGTSWTYQQDKFKADGIQYVTSNVVYRAVSEEVHGGETWLRVVDDSSYLVYLLKVKSGGLYQFANNASYLLCKSPAAVNDVYTTYNRGSTETFTVKEVNISIGSANGSSYHNVNKYEGYQGTELFDLIWYNSETWFPRRETYIHDPFTGIYRRDKRLILFSISY